MLALRSCGSLVEAAAVLARSGGDYGRPDGEGSRCLSRAAAWVVGLRGSSKVEEAMLSALDGDAPPADAFSSPRSLFITLLGPDSHCTLGVLQLLEALVRRRVANVRKLAGVRSDGASAMHTLTSVYSFRQDRRVHHAATLLFTWLFRCPEQRAQLMSIYGEDQLKPATERQRRLSFLVDGSWNIDSVDSPEYTAETGISIGDGPTDDA